MRELGGSPRTLQEMQDAATFALKDAKVQYYLAQCSLAQGHVEAACKAYQQAVKLDAKVTDASFATELDRAWADSLYRQGRFPEAIPVYEALLRKAEARQAIFSPEERVQIHTKLARAYGRQGKSAQAAEHKRKAAQYRKKVVQREDLTKAQVAWVRWLAGGVLAAGLQFFILWGLLMIVCIAVAVLRGRTDGGERPVKWSFKEVMKVYGEFFVWPVVGLVLYALALARGNLSGYPLTPQAGWLGLAVILAGPILFLLTIRRRLASKFSQLYPGVPYHSLDAAIAARSLLGWELLATMVVHILVGTISLVLVMEMLAGQVAPLAG